MRLMYYKPAINQGTDLSAYRTDPGSLRARYIDLVDGERTADEIAKMLLVNGDQIADIMAVMNELQKEGIISESPESDLGMFEPEELEALQDQLKAMSRLYADKNGMFIPFSSGALSHQRRIKEGKVMIIGNGKNTALLITRLSKLGIGELHYYIYGSEELLEQEDIILDALNADSNPFCKVFIHKVFSNEIDTDIIKNTDADLVIYMADNFSEQTAIDLNKICEEQQKDYLPYKSTFPIVYVGPFYIHKQTSCYKCYQVRKTAADVNIGHNPAATQANSMDVAIGVDFVCYEVFKYYSYMLELVTVNKVWGLNVMTGKTSLDPVFKLPRCPLCGISKIKPAKKLWENI